MTLTAQKVESEVVAILQDMTRDWDLELETIRLDTLLVEDLDFGSIDIIHLTVSIEEQFKKKLDFGGLILRGGKYVADISVRELVDFVTEKLNQD